MSWNELKVGAIYHGTVGMLGPLTGASQAYYRLGFPQFDRIVSLSTGALIAVAICPWREERFAELKDTVLRLRGRDIFSTPWEKKATVILSAGALSLPLLSRLEPKGLSHRQKLALDLLKTAAGLGVTAYLGYSLFKSKSLFSNEPLKELLTRVLDFKGVRQSKTEVIIMATDFQTGEHVAFSTKEAGIGPYDIVMFQVASSTVPLYFAVCSYRGRLFTDGEVVSDFPIKHLHEMDVVFDFCFSLDQPVHNEEPRVWGEHYHGTWDIRARHLTIKDRDEYDKARLADPNLPEVVTITTNQEIPHQIMETYNPESVKRAIDLGAEIMLENERKIREALDRAKEKKRRVSQ